ncbi:hypothetical protein G6F55_013861 [Rhizopus delemar]|nr:hypothetical protein G6F55_013861 [Rhizopus delemar]
MQQARSRARCRGRPAHSTGQQTSLRSRPLRPRAATRRRCRHLRTGAAACPAVARSGSPRTSRRRPVRPASRPRPHRNRAAPAPARGCAAAQPGAACPPAAGACAAGAAAGHRQRGRGERRAARGAAPGRAIRE